PAKPSALMVLALELEAETRKSARKPRPLAHNVAKTPRSPFVPHRAARSSAANASSNAALSAPPSRPTAVPRAQNGNTCRPEDIPQRMFERSQRPLWANSATVDVDLLSLPQREFSTSQAY